MKYVEVIIDNNSDHTDMLYTYTCEDDNVRAGDVVTVPFGKGNRKLRAFVCRVSSVKPEGVSRLKSVSSIDEDISLTPEMVLLAGFIRNEYMCKYIDAFNVMVPPGQASKRAGGRPAPYEKSEIERDVPPVLTEEQEAAVGIINGRIDSGGHETFLLHGVTGSGKTEVYMRTIGHCIERGLSAIVLVPEISLTPQTIDRFIARFGKENVSLFHSKLTTGQRYDQWMKAAKGGAKIMIGARSALFAPLRNIGIIIIDEEHESSYKSDMTPKYETSEAARKRAELLKIPLVLGSATPSVVSNFRAESGVYTKITLENRYNQVMLPKAEIVDMREELRMGNRTVLSDLLYEGIKENIESGKQVILFLNRRGYSSFVSCRNCGYILKCDDCDISMTYHKSSNMAECHYCGRTLRVPQVCPECGSTYIKHFGTGTEKVEEMINEIFPEYETARLDLDTTKLKGSMEKILKEFKKGKTKILIGTQLVAKGLDFANVGLVGIIAADITLNIPDFRSPERTFQLITQAAGRAGRGEDQGRVIIQTYTPDNYAVVTAAKNDYNTFYRNELIARNAAFYPPYAEIIMITVSSENEDHARSEAALVKKMADELLHRELTAEDGRAAPLRILGPMAPYRTRVSGQYRFRVVMRCEERLKHRCIEAVGRIRRERAVSSYDDVFVTVDVNPYSFG